jgi:uracil DNA glycosylase
VKTPWNDTAAGSLGEAASGSGTDPYAAYKAAVGVSFSRTVSGPLARLGSDAQDIAKVITRAVTAQRPRTRYLINPVAKSVVTLNRLLPGRAYDAVIRRQYGLPG